MVRRDLPPRLTADQVTSLLVARPWVFPHTKGSWVLCGVGRRFVGDSRLLGRSQGRAAVEGVEVDRPLTTVYSLLSQVGEDRRGCVDGSSSRLGYLGLACILRTRGAVSCC